MSAQTIRSAKRRAKQTELGILLGLWALLMYAWNQTPWPLKVAMLAVLYAVAWEITRHWVIALMLLGIWLGYRVVRSRRIRRAWGSMAAFKFYKGVEPCPFCGYVHDADSWCSTDTEENQ